MHSDKLSAVDSVIIDRCKHLYYRPIYVALYTCGF